jgi:hypothetical protein
VAAIADGQGPATSPRTSSKRHTRLGQLVFIRTVFVAPTRHRLPGPRKVPPSRLRRPAVRRAGSARDRSGAPGFRRA